MIRYRCTAKLLLVLAVGVLGFGCGGDNPLDDADKRVPRIDSFSAEPEHLLAPGSTTLTWVTTDATAVTIQMDGVDLESDESIPLSGSLEVMLDGTATFELIATSTKGEPATETLIVSVDAPSIGTFSASELVGVDEFGVATAELSWTGVVGARELVIESTTLDPISLDPAAGPDGNLQVEITADTTFTLIARNASGEAEESATTLVAAYPSITSFVAARPWVGSGEKVLLSWETSDATSIELWQNGSMVEEVDGEETNGTFEPVVLLDTTFELRAYNETGTWVSETVDVVVKTPIIHSFVGTEEARWLGQPLELSWITEGGSSVELTLSGQLDPICSSDDLTVVDSSICEWEILEPGDYAFTLTVSNGSGSNASVWLLTVGTGPVITRFTVAPERVSDGTPVTIAWATLPDPAGESAEVTLTDDHGTTYSASGETGEIFVTPDAGFYEFTLQASTSHPLSISSVAKMELAVYPLPTVALNASPLHFDEELAEDVTFTWTSTDASSLKLFRLVDGLPEIELVEIDEADFASGQFHYYPNEEASYRIVATNPAGGTAQAEVTVTLAPPRISSFTVNPTELIAGQPVTLSWDTAMAPSVKLDAFAGDYLIEETQERFLDVSDTGGVWIPMTVDCFADATKTPVIDTDACVAFDLPGGFAFPFDGATHSKVRVFKSGAISFTPDTLPLAPHTNVAFPTTDPAKGAIHLAPFWDALMWPPAEYPDGNLYYQLREDAAGDSVVIQWKDISLNGITYHPKVRLNFEVILWENGDFEYRYGKIESTDPLFENFANGALSTIGFQTPSQSSHTMLNLNNNVRVRGPLYNRSFRFRAIPELRKSGSLVWHPYSNVNGLDVTLTASRGSLSVSETRSLTVFEGPLVLVSQSPQEPVLINTDFRIGWTTERAYLVEIFDGSGVEVCRVDTPASVAQGFCTLQESDQGNHSYSIKVSGEGGVSTEREILLSAYVDFGIVRFESDKEDVEVGESLELSWITHDAASISILANGLELLPPGTDPDSGLVLVPAVMVDTTFVLRITNSLGMFKEETISIETWTIEFKVTSNATKVRPGDPVTIQIVANSLDGGAPPAVYGSFPLLEVTDPASKYSDISTVEGAIPLNLSTAATNTVNNLTFSKGFLFPYFDGFYNELRTHADGYVSLNLTAGNTSTNLLMPTNSTASNNAVNFAPFWDDLFPRTPGRMWTLETPDTFILQWSNMSLSGGSGTTVFHDLNFQLVLHRSGAIEYRYGTMKGLATGTSTSCHPSPGTCDNEANGSSATIGYQDPTGTIGYTLHFGGSNNGASNPAFDGGLTNRTFKAVPLVGSGDLTFNPTRTGTYTFCAKSGARPVCKSIEVNADFGIDSFASASPSTPFGTPTVLSWETQGGKKLVIRKDGGAEVFSTTDPAVIDAGTLTVNPATNSTYTLELEAPLSRAESTVEIEVIRLAIAPTVSANSVFPGTPVNLSWTLNVADPGYQVALVTPMEEISGPGTSFYDLDQSHMSGDAQIIGTTTGLVHKLNFGPGFTFPYFGEEMSWVRVSSEGYLSFWDESTVSPTNQPLPNSAVSNRRIQIAPFWDNLNTFDTGRVLAVRVDPDTYVIQWSATSRHDGGSNSNKDFLNFMVVLRSTGEFEFRYGQMLQRPLPATNTSHCNPLDCVNEVNGSSATIGYQDVTGSVAYTLHYGGNPSLANRKVGGGLSNRSWKFTPRSAAGTVQVAPWDTTEYQICSIEVVSRDIFCSDPVEVASEWGIRSFEGSPKAVLRNAPVTLSWEVVGLDDLEILADGVPLQAYTRATMQLNGTFNHTPNATTTYTLVGTSLGRQVSEERLVELRTLNLTMQAPTGRHFPGDSVSIQWNLDQLEPGPFAVTSPMVEIGAGPGGPGQYQDISGMPGAVVASPSANNGSFKQVIPFDFPYFGTMYREMIVHVSGYISFDPAGTSVRSGNVPLPTTAADRAVHLAVFWDQLFIRAPGRIVTYQPDANSFIIQWTNFNRTGGSNATNLYDMNFQIILFADGSFEYRYGKMTPPPPPFSNSTCYPDTCWEEANGSSATIGYQTVEGEYGYTFHFGGQNAAGVVPLPGGLNNRALKFTPAKSGTAQFVLDGSKDVTLCASAGAFKECKSVFIQAVADPGDLAITELMIDPAGGEANQWFEVRNLSKRVIDLEGFEIKTDTGTHQISTPLLVGAGEYLTFAPSAGVGFSPSYSYGTGLSYNTQVDTLKIDAGAATIHSVNWDVTWTVPSGTTLYLDPGSLSHGLVSHNNFNQWCPGDAAGTPGQRTPGCKSAYYDVEPYSTLPFFDISTIGTRVPEMEIWYGLAKIPVAGFSMPFFDGVVNDIWANADGLVGFASTSPGSETTPPSTLPRNPNFAPNPPLYGVFWDTFTCAPDKFACSFRYHRGVFNGQDMVILQWTGYKREHSFGSVYAGSATFQAQIWMNGTIVTSLADVYSEDSEGSESWNYYHGTRSWIGLEGPSRDYVTGHHWRATDMSHRSISFIRK